MPRDACLSDIGCNFLQFWCYNNEKQFWCYNKNIHLLYDMSTKMCPRCRQKLCFLLPKLFPRALAFTGENTSLGERDSCVFFSHKLNEIWSYLLQVYSENCVNNHIQLIHQGTNVHTLVCVYKWPSQAPTTEFRLENLLIFNLLKAFRFFFNKNKENCHYDPLILEIMRNIIL